jgi:hypothetical protein
MVTTIPAIVRFMIPSMPDRLSNLLCPAEETLFAPIRKSLLSY